MMVVATFFMLTHLCISSLYAKIESMNYANWNYPIYPIYQVCKLGKLSKLGKRFLKTVQSTINQLIR